MALLQRTFGDQVPGFIEWVPGDINDIESLEDAMEGIREVYHCAGLVSFLSSDYRRLMKINVEGTANVVTAALNTGIRRRCHVSSTAALGRSEENTPITEETSWKNSRHNSSYAISKFLGECEVWRGMEEGLEAFVVNPSIVLGAGNMDSGSAALFGAVKRGMPFYPTGSSGFVDVRDVSRCMIGLMDKGANSSRYILNGGNYSYKEVLDAIAHGFGVRPPSFPVSAWMGELAWRGVTLFRLMGGGPSMLTRETVRNGRRHWLYSNDKIRAELGIEFTPLRQTAADTCQMLLEKKFTAETPFDKAQGQQGHSA